MKLRKAWWILWMLLTLLGAAAAVDWQIATYRVDGPREMISKWDETNQRVLSYRNQTPRDPVAIQINETDGSQTVSINLIRDFPGAINAIVSDIASGPDRSLVAVCRIVYEVSKVNKAPSLKELVLTYSSTGTLTKVWDVFPYENEALSVNQQGHVYTFGERVDASNGANYGTVVEYDPNGKVVKEMLPLSSFPAGAEGPTTYQGKTGPCFLNVSRDKIYIYAAVLQKVYVLGTSGNLVRQYSTKSFLDNVAASNGYGSYEVGRGFFDSVGNLYFDMRLEDPILKWSPAYMFVAAKLDSEATRSSHWAIAKSSGRPWVDPRLIGVTADGSVVSLVDRADAGTSVEIRNH
jgi:hypothetical protein